MSTEDEFDSFKAYGDTADPSLLQSSHEEQNLLAQVATLDDLYLDIVSPPFHLCGEETRYFQSFNSQNSLVEANEDKPYAFPSASLEILRGCRSRNSTVNRKRVRELSNEAEEKASSPSINHIIKLSAAIFIQSKQATGNEIYAIIHPYADSYLGLSEENARDVRLVQDLLSCAEKVSNQQYHSASKLLEECHKQSFLQMNKTQRLVHYFTQALFEKIERGIGRCTRDTTANDGPSDPISPSPALSAFFEKVPFSQITQFAGIQSMVEHVSNCRKVHVIDLDIRCGVHQIVLMQALADRRTDQFRNSTIHFKITSISIKLSPVIDETGFRLRAMAASLNLDFTFNVISLEDVFNLQMSLYDRDEDEELLVYSAHALEKLVSRPRELDILMRIIKRMNPRGVFIIEAEANVNSPIFVNRFVESLLFCGAYFDSLEDCLKNDVAERSFIEAEVLNPVVRNTVAAEGAEREHRIVGIKVWRAFLARFKMVEMELSELAITHAKMILDRFECRDSCTLGFNGDSLIVSWKDTSICSLSVWKFR